MDGVVILKDGLAEDPEVVAVFSDQHEAKLVVPVNIPRVVLGANCDPVVCDHKTQWLEPVTLVAVYEDKTLFHSVLDGAACRSCPVFKQGLHHGRRDDDCRGAGVENGVGSSLQGIAPIESKVDGLQTGRPEEVIIHLQSHSGRVVKFVTLHFVLQRLSEVNSRALVAAPAAHLERKAGRAYSSLLVKLLNQKRPHQSFSFTEKHFPVLRHAQNAVLSHTKAFLLSEGEVLELLDTGGAGR